MGSKVLFFKSTGDALSYWKKTAAPAFAACNAWAATQNLKPGASATPLESRLLSTPATGADSAAAYRTVTRLDVPEHPSYDCYETTVFVRTGRALALVHVAYRNQVCECYVGIARLLTQRLRAANR
jgi:hypothetical protein